MRNEWSISGSWLLKGVGDGNPKYLGV